VGVLDTNDNAALGLAAAALRDANIVFDVVPIADLPANPGSPEPKWWIRPCRILVSVEDASEARELLEPFQRAMPLSELVPDLAADPKMPRKIPLIHKLGVGVNGSFCAVGGVVLLYESLKARSILLAMLGIAFPVGLTWGVIYMVKRASR
jgi:hypothetical protein